jgi:hypothetical protein
MSNGQFDPLKRNYYRYDVRFQWFSYETHARKTRVLHNGCMQVKRIKTVIPLKIYDNGAVLHAWPVSVVRSFLLEVLHD